MDGAESPAAGEGGPAQLSWAENGVAAGSDRKQTAPLIDAVESHVIVAWVEEKAAKQYEIRAQRINQDGNRAWAAEGVVAATLATEVDHEAATSLSQVVIDANGGAFLVYREYGMQQVRLTHVNADGVVLSTPSIAIGNGSITRVIADDAGGVVAVYYHSTGLRAQSFDADLQPRWAQPLLLAADIMPAFDVEADGAGAFFVAWSDNRNKKGSGQCPASGDSVYYVDVYAQKVNFAGQAQWASGGVAVAAGRDYQHAVQVLNDAGNAYVTFTMQECIFGGRQRTEVARLSAAGAVEWSVPTVLSSFDNSSRLTAAVVSSGSLVAAYDSGKTGDLDVLGASLTSAGAHRWPGGEAGTAIVSERYDQGFSADTVRDITSIGISDNTGGAFFALYRESAPTGLMRGDRDLYVVHVDGAGQVKSDLPLSRGPWDQTFPVLAKMGNGAVVAAWQDGRDSGQFSCGGVGVPYPCSAWSRVYLQRVQL